MSKASVIRKSFGHKLIGTDFMKRRVVKALLLLPDEIVKFITKNVWFVGSFTDGWAFTLRHDDLKKGEYLIFLSDELLREDDNQITYTILHEIGHVILGHRNSIGEIQSKGEIRKQESEANKFAKRYI